MEEGKAVEGAEFMAPQWYRSATPFDEAAHRPGRPKRDYSACILAMMASAIWLVPTAVGSVRLAFMS